MPPRLRKAMLTAHVVVSVGWLGAALAMTVLSVRALVIDDPETRVGIYTTMHFFDLALNAPLSVSMLITSLISALYTKWGLVQHRWVLTKLVLSLTLLIAMPVLSAPRLTTLAETIPRGVEPSGTAVQVVIIAICATTTLTTITAISVIKPWGRTRWYRSRRPIS